jgi:hemerythrin-like domain-containing protein
MTTKKTPRPDTNQMVRIHRVFRETLGAADAHINPVPPEDAARVAVLANFYNNVLAFVKVHHDGEDELLFSLLRARCPDDLELIDRVSSQHHDVDDLIASAHESLIAWAAGDDGARERAAKSLTELGSALAEHLDAEEAEVLPLCAEHMTVQEWGALSAYGMANFGGDKIWLVLGLIRDRFTQRQRAEMLANMPPPAVEMWTNVGENAYRALLAEVGPPLK